MVGEAVVASLAEQRAVEEHARPLAQLHHGTGPARGAQAVMAGAPETNVPDRRHVADVVIERAGVLAGEDPALEIERDVFRPVHAATLAKRRYRAPVGQALDKGPGGFPDRDVPVGATVDQLTQERVVDNAVLIALWRQHQAGGVIGQHQALGRHGHAVQSELAGDPAFGGGQAVMPGGQNAVEGKPPAGRQPLHQVHYDLSPRRIVQGIAAAQVLAA